MKPDSIVPCRWTGEAFEPMAGYRKRADMLFTVGEVYPMQAAQPRSGKSHRHEFAFVKTAFDNLPEHLSGRFASPEHLRKRALISMGFHSETHFHLATPDEAQRFALYAREEDEFAIVRLDGELVSIWRAESQSEKAMEPERFQQSKEAVLMYCANLLGVSVEELNRNRTTGET